VSVKKEGKIKEGSSSRPFAQRGEKKHITKIRVRFRDNSAETRIPEGRGSS